MFKSISILSKDASDCGTRCESIILLWFLELPDALRQLVSSFENLSLALVCTGMRLRGMYSFEFLVKKSSSSCMTIHFRFVGVDVSSAGMLGYNDWHDGDILDVKIVGADDDVGVLPIMFWGGADSIPNNAIPSEG